MTDNQLYDVAIMLDSLTSQTYRLKEFFVDQGCTEDEVRGYVKSANALALAAGLDPILDEAECLGLLEG